MHAAMHRGDFIDGRFEIEDLAGAGGMGMVYRACDRMTGNLVAIKLLHNTDASHTARFMREIHALSSVTHEHVVQYITHGVTDEDEPYLVMEWLEGESLDDWLAYQRLELAQALELVRRVAEALGAAHARGIVHRDIKPSNLFLVDGDVARVKVLDFGIAQFAEDTLVLTHTNQVIGTAGYMAPEQARGEQARIDARSDVFSLGCVLFECLTGRPAFEGAHLMALLSKLLLDQPPRVRTLAPDVPAAVDGLVATMMDRNPAVRPANGMVVARALAALAGSADPANAEHPEMTVIARAEQRLAAPGKPAAQTAQALRAIERPAVLLDDVTCELGGRFEVVPAQAYCLWRGSGTAGASRELLAGLHRREIVFPVRASAPRHATGERAGICPRSAVQQGGAGGDGDRDDETLLAASIYHRAALQALRGHELAAARAHVQRGLELGPGTQARSGLQAIHAAVCFWSGDHAASYESARQALDLAAPGTQAHWLALSMAILGAGYTGEHEAFTSLVASLLDREPDTSTSVELDRFMLDAFWGAFAALITSGQVSQAERCLLRLERIVSPRREREPFAAACLETAYAYWHRHVERAPWAALEHSRATLALYERAGEPGSRDLQQALIVACELVELGAFAEAEEIVEQWLRAGPSSSFAGLWTTYARARVYACTRRLDEALALATATEAQARAQGERVLAVRLRYIMIDCSIERGDIAEAEQMLLGMSEPRALPSVDRPEFLATLARIRLKQGRHREAARLAREGLAADEVAGIGVYATRDTCRLVCAEALHAMGEMAAATQAIRTAHEDLLARAARIDRSAHRSRFLHDVPLHARILGLARDWLGREPA